jgi:glycyl-tRNA synthetase beta subunit
MQREDSPHPNPSPKGEGLIEDDLVRLLARVKALQGFISSPDGANLLAGYKRAANILKQSPSPLAGEGGPKGRVRGTEFLAP